MPQPEIILTDFKLAQKTKTVQLTFNTGETFTLDVATLRAHSPSAENRHSVEQGQVAAFSSVQLISVEPVGNYALRLIFDDGHQTGLYHWAYLYQLASKKHG